MCGEDTLEQAQEAFKAKFRQKRSRWSVEQASGATWMV